MTDLIFIYLFRLAASKCFYLCKLGVTHVLNAAEGRKEKNGTVDTNKVEERALVWKLTALSI